MDSEVVMLRSELEELRGQLAAAEPPSLNAKLLRDIMFYIIDCNEETDTEGLCSCARAIGEVIQKFEGATRQALKQGRDARAERDRQEQRATVAETALAEVQQRLDTLRQNYAGEVVERDRWQRRAKAMLRQCRRLRDRMRPDPETYGGACSRCGYELVFVRPGKWQCNCCEMEQRLTERAEESERELAEARAALATARRFIPARYLDPEPITHTTGDGTRYTPAWEAARQRMVQVMQSLAASQPAEEAPHGS